MASSTGRTRATPSRRADEQPVVLRLRRRLRHQRPVKPIDGIRAQLRPARAAPRAHQPSSVRAQPRATSTLVSWFPHYTRLYVEEWNFTIQKQLPANIVWETSYVGNIGIHMCGQTEGNQPLTNGPGAVNRRPLLTTRSPPSSISAHGTTALTRAFRLALKSVSRRDSRSLQASPIAERSTSRIPRSMRATAAAPAIPCRMRTIGARSAARRRTTSRCASPSAASGPAFRSRPRARPTWMGQSHRRLLAGQHHLPGAKRPPLHRQSTVRQRQRGHDFVTQPRVPRDARASDALPMVRYELLRRPAGVFGNEGRNVLTGPGRNNVDFVLHRSFPIPRWESGRLEFRGEAYNLFNNPQFAIPE